MMDLNNWSLNNFLRDKTKKHNYGGTLLIKKLLKLKSFLIHIYTILISQPITLTITSYFKVSVSLCDLSVIRIWYSVTVLLFLLMCTCYSVMSPLALMVLRVCAQGPHDCGLLTLDSAAVWLEGLLPGEQHRAMGLARMPGTLSSSGFCLKCNSQLALISPHHPPKQSGELRQVCVFVQERNWVLCYRASKNIDFLNVCECVRPVKKNEHKTASPFSLLRSCTRCW